MGISAGAALRRVALAGFLHETNTFAPSTASLAAFQRAGGRPPLSRSAEIIGRCSSINRGIAGAIAHAEKSGWEIVPILWAAATPSAHVEREAFETITGEIVEGIAAAGRLDGIYLDLHGAMVTEHLDDGEGELLSRVREAVGRDVPIVASLDLHGNVTAQMVEKADLLVAFRTYPHVDMAETGRRAADGLDKLMTRGKPFAKASRRLPYLIPIPWQCTLTEPARSLYAELEALECGSVASLSYLMGFPAADIEACGQSVLAYACTQEAANYAADTLYRRILECENSFAGHIYQADDGIKEAMRIAETASRPVVLADAQDNPGAGGDSNTTGMLRALLSNQATRAAIGLIVDPQAARAAHSAGEGTKLNLALGGQSGCSGDAPLEATFRVEKLSDGRLHATGPFYGGVHLDVGPSACLSVDGVKVVVATNKAQMADLAMYRFVGIEPTEMAILINKSSVHFRADFEPIAEAVLVCAAPGPVLLDPAEFHWTKLANGMRLFPNGPTFHRQPEIQNA